MKHLCALLTTTLEEDLLEYSSVRAQDFCKVLINKYNEYGGGWGRRNMSSSSSGKGKKSHRSWRSRTSSTESSCGGSFASEQKIYYMEKLKFTVRDNISYLIANNGWEWHTDMRSPGDCDKCGGRHWEWVCGKCMSKK